MAVVTPTHCRVVLLPEAKGKAIVETTYELSFTFDVELDLCNPDLHATFTMPDETVPLRGKWECRVFWRSGEELVFNVQHGIRDCTPPDSQTLIDRSPDSDLIASPHNVRFVFPNTDGELWARSDFLVRSSPYFKMLLSSDFAESVSVPSKRARSSKAKNLVAMDLDDEDVQDSDDETDGLYFNKHSPQSNKGDESQHPYKEIRITKTAFSTYRAVLAYLRTGHIAFAPLDSTFSSNPAADSSTRLSRIEAAVASDLSRPYPVSPKSTFCLAHLLELDQLQKQCLANLAKQLTVDGAPRELFDNTSVRHETWRRVIVTFAAKHWKEIKGSSSWLEMEGKISRDELPSSGSIMLELMKARDQLSGMHQQSLFKSFESEKTSRAA